MASISVPTAPPVLRSWQRCRMRGQSTTIQVPIYPGPLTDTQHALVLEARSSIEDLYQLIERPGFAVLLADAHAVALHLEGDPAIVDLARRCGLTPPIALSEEQVGTNAIDLALREALPVQTTGSDHYATLLRPLAIAAAPIFNVAGQPLGVLAIITSSDGAHPHTLGIAIATAQSLHNQLRAEQLLADANDQLAELYATLETMHEGLIFIGEGGDIRRINSRAGEILGLNSRSASGRPLEQLVSPPELVRIALAERKELSEQELLWMGRKNTLAALCSVHPVWDRAQRYLGALIIIRPSQSVHRLVQRMVGAHAQFTFRDIIGQSPDMLQALHQAHMAANATGCVLLTGEPGVGKELFAQAIHNASERADGPFVQLNCAAVPRPLLGGELFGIESDPQRPDQAGRPGRIELAHGGVLYLEEVGALSFELQTSLLRMIEMRRNIRMGGSRPMALDVRIIITGADLERQVQEGRFRADLAARLSAFTIDIPALRERGDDLLLLINHMLLVMSERLGRQVALSPDALQALRAYPWPGNVRELEVTLERILHSNEKSVLTRDDLPAAVVQVAAPLAPPPIPALADNRDLTERDTIVRAGKQASGHLGRTAELLGISRATLWRKMVRYHITKTDFWPDTSSVMKRY